MQDIKETQNPYVGNGEYIVLGSTLNKWERSKKSYWLSHFLCFGNPELYVHGLVQEKRNAIANALELRLYSTNPWMYPFYCNWTKEPMDKHSFDM